MDQVATIEIDVGDDGSLTTVYKDEILSVLQELGQVTVKRASHVEFERTPLFDGWFQEGWTVRAAWDPELAIRHNPMSGRYYVGREGTIVTFMNRERALQYEIENFWKLLPPVTQDKE